MLVRRAVHAEAILRAAITAAEPERATAAAIRADDFAGGSVHVLSVGKAAVAMCRAALRALPQPPTSCLLIAPQGGSPHGFIPCRMLTGAHPIPDATSVRAGQAAAGTLRAAAAGDTVLALLSGGASSLCVLPEAGVTLEDYAGIVAALLRGGADIRELNAVRGALDTLKAGGMAALAAPARVVTLIISDVPGDDPAVIASGPFSASPASPTDALDIMRRYGVDTSRVAGALADSAAAAPALDHVTTHVILRNADACRGAAQHARNLGYHVLEFSDIVTGAAREQGRLFAARVLEIDRGADVPTCVIAGGETTVTVHGDGRGGRNQELVLAALLELSPQSRVVIGSIGTDGKDGPTDAAGAIADADTLVRAAERSLDPRAALHRNDSWSFFRRAGGQIRTGPTGTNVMDVMIGMAGPPV